MRNSFSSAVRLLLAAACLTCFGVWATEAEPSLRDFSATNDVRRATRAVDAEWVRSHRVGTACEFTSAYGADGAVRTFRLESENRVGGLTWKDDLGHDLELKLPGEFSAHGYRAGVLPDGRVLLVYRSARLNPTNRCWLVGWVGPVASLIEKDQRAVGTRTFLFQPPADAAALPRRTGVSDALDVRIGDDGGAEIVFLGDDAPAGASAAVWSLSADDLACKVSAWARWRPNLVWFGGLLKDLMVGLVVSCEIFFLTLLCALPLGLLVAFGRMSRHRFLSSCARIYISVMRGTPLMLQIIFVYYGPNYLFGWDLAGYPLLLAAVIAFSLNYAAYFAEIYRSGIQSIEAGQWEAATSLGLSRRRAFFRIVFPQVVKRVLPAVTNEVITLVKDTSLAFTISLAEMFTMARQVAAAGATIMPLVAAGVFYYVFNFVVAWTMERIEKHYAYYR